MYSGEKNFSNFSYEPYLISGLIEDIIRCYIYRGNLEAIVRLLKMDFQPLFMSGLALRRVDRSHWTTIQKGVVAAVSPSCIICGFVAQTKRSLIHADEVWSFPGPPNVLLSDVRPLCVNCHDAKDYGGYLRRVLQGIASPTRCTAVIEHYCSVNGCSTIDFDADYKDEQSRKREIEALYRWNVEKNLSVDYGAWDRPADRPRLSATERKRLKEMFRDRDEPIFVEERSITNFGAAVRWLQSIPIEGRSKILIAMEDSLIEQYEDDEALSETDEGVQFQ